MWSMTPTCHRKIGLSSLFGALKCGSASDHLGPPVDAYIGSMSVTRISWSVGYQSNLMLAQCNIIFDHYCVDIVHNFTTSYHLILYCIVI